MYKQITNQTGSALVVTLLMLIMLTFIGIASITTSVRDMDISKNTTDRTKAFFVAEGGLEAAQAIMSQNGAIVGNDTLLQFISPYTTLPSGRFSIALSGTIPFKSVTSLGNASDGEAAVQVLLRRRRAPSIWNNVMFAGSGQQGNAINGNVAYHGPITILGDGEDFTDVNGNGNWDDADQFTDGNGNGLWDPGEPLTSDANGNGLWDPAEPFQDGNGNSLYDGTLTATDLAAILGGTAGMYNNYSGIPASLSSRIPTLDQILYNGEMVYTLDAELRVKHGVVNLNGTALIGDQDQSGGSPAIKETVDGTYVNDGWGGNQGTNNVYSDNGYSNTYDMGDELAFPSLLDEYTDPNSGITYLNYETWIAANSYVIAGDLHLSPGMAYGGGSNSYGSISMDNSGNLSMSGIVYVTGNVYFDKNGSSSILYEGSGTIVSGGDMHINTKSILSQGGFPSDDVLGFLSTQNLYIGMGAGASQMDLMGAFFAQNKIQNAKQNHMAGSMVSNYFEVENVPHFYFVPSLQDNLPPGMPGGGRGGWVYKKVPGTWREL